MSTITNPNARMLGIDAITQAASSGIGSSGKRSVSEGEASSWFEAMAGAWGKALDDQAATIATMSEGLTSGGDQPSMMVKISAESMRMQFMSNSASTSNNSVGQALETLGRKQ
ncbi:hypothetical protein ACQQ2N_16735 [Dokdonella sp. MW10]|uniref:hypothetical protein n=1 Tax=Dokdonella sp. MW10 TaxID=2992926 RepID=UPI003F80CA5C